MTQRELALFSRDFSYLTARRVSENSDLGFYVGREPTFDDIALERDIARLVTTPIKNEIRDHLRQGSDACFLVFEDNAGTGKSTIARRALYDLASEGIHVFVHQSVNAIDLDLCLRVMNHFRFPMVLYCDNIADHIASFIELYRKLSRNDFIIFGTERSYRAEHVSAMLAGLPSKRIAPQRFGTSEAKSLIVKVDRYGLTTNRLAPDKLDSEASELTTDSIAIAVCRIMNDYRPIERIIDSLIENSDSERLSRYIACSIATHCYRQGLKYSILVAAIDATGLSRQFNAGDILPLTFFDYTTREYVTPSNRLRKNLL